MFSLKTINKLKIFSVNPVFRKCFSTLQKLTLCEDTDGIRTITLNNPSKRNTLSFDLLSSLQNDINKSNKNLSAIIIKAAGNVFSSGHNLKELADVDLAQKTFDLLSNIMISFQKLPVPVIAQVQGLATAAGCQLVASCDIAVASESSKFATPGVANSLFCTTPGVALARSVPRKTALMMLFTAEPINSQEALRCGLVSKVVPDEELQKETLRIAEKIKQFSRPVMQLGKRAFYRQIELSLSDAYKFGSDTMVENLKMEDSQEGIEAFAQKRKPSWKHK